MAIVSPGQATAVGNALIPPEGPAAVPLVLDFSKAGSFNIDVQQLMQKGNGYPGLSVIQTVYVDNEDNPDPFVINVSATGQNITVGAGVQGYYPIFSPGQGTISFSTGSQAIVSVFLANVPIPPTQWGGSTGGGGGGIPEAPDDGQTYGRKSDGWTAIAAGFPDAPDDGQYYARLEEAWAAFLPFPEAPNNGSAYVRKSKAWALATAGGGIPDAPDDGNTYGRNDGAWVEVTGGGGGGGGGLNSDTYWDPSHVNTYGQVVDATGKCASCFVQTGQWLSMLANKSQTQGKLYFEAAFTTVSNPGPMIGVASAQSDRTWYIGHDAYGWSMNMQGTTFGAGAGSGSTMAGYANGDICGVAVDFTDGTISFTKNGVANGEITGLALAAPLFPATASPNTATTMTAYFKAADLQYLPAGYSAWGE